ncbi:MAG: hypothetical protein JWM88_113 [Verrucomicrobia bacterium]|nr:hypothetical protein [Verrucomicrobiota bacterium]
MIRRLSFFLLLAAGLRAAPEPVSTHRFYAAVGMTKAQKNTSTPLDSGIYLRGEDGKWTLFGPRILGVTSLAMSPADSQVLLLASADGIVRTNDGGKSWRKVTGWEVADVRSIVFDPRDPRKVYAATTWGPLRSEDGGDTWALAEKGLTKLYCQTIVADTARPGRVLLGTEDGVYLSTNRAASWRRARFPTASVLRLAQSAADPKLVAAVTQGHGAWLSRDAGRSWSATDLSTATANLYALALSPHDAAQMAIGGWGAGVRVSADGGQNWSDRTAGLPARNIFVLAFDPDAKGRLWASTFEEGTFYSDDLGATWHDGGLYGAYASDFVFLPARR